MVGGWEAAHLGPSSRPLSPTPGLSPGRKAGRRRRLWRVSARPHPKPGVPPGPRPALLQDVLRGSSEGITGLVLPLLIFCHLKCFNFKMNT